MKYELSITNNTEKNLSWSEKEQLYFDTFLTSDTKSIDPVLLDIVYPNKLPASKWCLNFK